MCGLQNAAKPAPQTENVERKQAHPGLMPSSFPFEHHDQADQFSIAQAYNPRYNLGRDTAGTQSANEVHPKHLVEKQAAILRDTSQDQTRQELFSPDSEYENNGGTRKLSGMEDYKARSTLETDSKPLKAMNNDSALLLGRDSIVGMHGHHLNAPLPSVTIEDVYSEPDNTSQSRYPGQSVKNYTTDNESGSQTKATARVTEHRGGSQQEFGIAAAPTN